MATKPRIHHSEVVVDGLRFAEGPRWRPDPDGGRLWFSDMHDGLVRTLDGEGRLETVCRVPGDPSGLGWLPDGRLLVVSMRDRKLLRLEPDGTLTEHADLSRLAGFHCNDMVVGPDGRAWVGNFGFDLHAGADFREAELIRVDPDGRAEVVATGMGFPNGTVLTADAATLIVAESFAGRLTAFDIEPDGSLSGRRLWAQLPEGRIPDGICLDAEGAIWAASPRGDACLRIREGGEVTDLVQLDQGAFACMLGDADRRTLYVCSAVDSDPARTGDRSGRIERLRVEVPGAGWP